MSFSNPVIKVETHDMHTGGEPLRIIKSGIPNLLGNTVLEKREFAKTHLEDYRKLIINEPRGHKDMYGAILQSKKENNEFEVLFLNNEGYSPMCGHAIIALGRYVVDYQLINPVLPENEVVFHCPCGPIKAFVSSSGGAVTKIRFESVPAFLYKKDIKINVLNFGELTLDIAFGGAFYAIIPGKLVKLDVHSSPLKDVIDVASAITEAVKNQIDISHPTSQELSYLYGTIITDGNDAANSDTSTNICVFADKQVDRSPTGSGVTARMALQHAKGLISLNQTKEFKSVIGTSFTGTCVRETMLGSLSAVIVEVSGMAYHTGDHTFYLEQNDPLKNGFLLNN